MLGIRTSARQFAVGAGGERTVGRQLNRCAARYGWHVLHAVPVGQRGADIDHVVIGPFGVVTVNTKTTGTAVWVGARKVTVRGGGPAGVAVLATPRALRHWLHKQSPALQPDQVEAIYEAARRPASWQSK